MEFDEEEIKPSSYRELLYSQVEEQSDICDVTIQVGQWKKKYHWCVLVMSPFFDCIRRSDFKEKQTGLVKLDVATPLTTEIAILFLYGKKPKLTEENVAAVLDLSEFLLIPNLKAACVAFIKNISITEENCMRMLQMSSRYEFEFSQCDDYIRGHLPDILQTDEARFLTKESVLTLLADPLLSYVLAEDKFKFVIRWANTSKKNKDAFRDVFEVIELRSMTGEFLETVVSHNPIVTESRMSTLKLKSRETQQDHKVLIFPGTCREGRIACFDLESERWCGIETGLPEDDDLEYSITSADIEGTRGPGVIYRVSVANRYDFIKICSQDLQSKLYTVRTLSKPADTHPIDIFSVYDVTKDVFVAVSNERLKIKSDRLAQSNLSPADLVRSSMLERNKIDLISTFGRANIVEDERHCEVYIDTTTVFCDHFNQPEAHIRPLFSLRNTMVESVCINDGSYMALYSRTTIKLHIYDMSNGLLDTISLESYLGPECMYVEIRLAAKEDGFVICSLQCDIVLSIARLTGPTVKERYAVQKTYLEYHKGYDFQLQTYFNETWFRLLKKTWNSSDVEFACVSHDELMNTTAKEVIWKQLPSPHNTFNVSEGGRVFMMELQASMLRCHYDCPHCRQLKQQIAKQRHASSPRKIEIKIYDSDSGDPLEDDEDLYGESDGDTSGDS